jgi:putative transposase
MIPKREVATSNGRTYFVSSSSAQRRPFFRHERWAKLFLEVLDGYRPERYLLHSFVLMPDHFHLLLTPTASLELAVQCLKGGFSFRAKREFQWKGDIWATGFSDHRIRDREDFETHLAYIANNPAKAGLAVWLGFVTTVQLTNSLFSRQPAKLYAINTGYQLVCYLAMGAIMGAWR